MVSQSPQARYSIDERKSTIATDPTFDFQYQPLNTTKQEIRLVKLHRATADEHTHVFCDIHTFQLAAAPTYVALSYTWGAPEPKRVIFIGDEPHEVRENVYDFLYTYRSEAVNTEYIYIDQLCIDQDSPDERNHQVGLMSRIYARCAFVIVWLDLTSSDAVKDFEATSELAAAERILRNPYFTRLWIVQEVLLSPEVRVLCGQTWMSWTALGDLVWKMPDWYLSIHKADDKASMAWLFSASWKNMWNGQTRLPLDRCVDLFACMECEDPRDKIYGLLGLASDEEHPVIDYRKSVPEVFIDAVNALRNTHWKRCVLKGKVRDAYRRRCATYCALGRQMGLDPNSLRLLLTAVCDTEDLVLTTSGAVLDHSPVISLGVGKQLTCGCPSRWWYVYLGESHDSWFQALGNGLAEDQSIAFTSTIEMCSVPGHSSRSLPANYYKNHRSANWNKSILV